ncbi:MAG: hypothetical protein KIS76_15470 [Pyrinomonadaceae bacterium]|nr:hypothetical protein [Pyrinomonadaceae bacterium]
MQTEILNEKINGLPAEKTNEVEAFVDFLKQKSLKELREVRFREISEYAEIHAGSDADIDNELEQAGVEVLIKGENR